MWLYGRFSIIILQKEDGNWRNSENSLVKITSEVYFGFGHIMYGLWIFFQKFTKWLLLSMLISTVSILEILILDNLFSKFLSIQSLIWGRVHGYICNDDMVTWFRLKTTPMTASHIHVGCIERVWAPSYAQGMDRHLGAPLHSYTGLLTQIWVISGQCGYEMMSWWHGWVGGPLLIAFHIRVWYIETVWTPLYAVDRHVGAPLHSFIDQQVNPDLGNLGMVWL